MACLTNKRPLKTISISDKTGDWNVIEKFAGEINPPS